MQTSLPFSASFNLDIGCDLQYRRIMKSYFIDTAATVIFFTVVAALSELLIAGMDPKQVLIARLIMVPVMMITARPYGLWRDWFFSTTRPRGWMANVACDIIAFITFQVPVYVTTLALAGATTSEIVAAVSASIVFMIVLSRPFGIYLDAMRNWARTSVN